MRREKAVAEGSLAGVIDGQARYQRQPGGNGAEQIVWKRGRSRGLEGKSAAGSACVGKRLDEIQRIKANDLDVSGKEAFSAAAKNVDIKFYMDKYLIKKKSIVEETSMARANDDCSKRRHVEINLDDLPSDLGLRKRISDYHPNDRDRIRRHCLQQGRTLEREQVVKYLCRKDILIGRKKKNSISMLEVRIVPITKLGEDVKI
ncbi:zinc finger MYM-type protein 1-like [Canna indica]|uniref:Zinc finger MYM-type protein 1-like n=1 Tax=Canna indica TaxID=4628 RepID=A0AAQ3Q2C5_9LILI|nr:zinc finger MYM-type protein 1-like [Canna indica]